MASSKKPSDDAVAPEVTPDEQTPTENAPENVENAPETPDEQSSAPEGQDAAPESEEGAEDFLPDEEVFGVDVEKNEAWLYENTSSATREHIEQELAATGESPTLDGLMENN